VTEYSQHLHVSLGRVLWLWLRFTYSFCLCGLSVVIQVVLPSKHIFPRTIVKQDLIPPPMFDIYIAPIVLYCFLQQFVFVHTRRQICVLKNVKELFFSALY
jgi:hypothetical protein